MIQRGRQSPPLRTCLILQACYFSGICSSNEGQYKSIIIVPARRANHNGKGHLCRRMFLGSRSHFSPVARRHLNPGRLHRRTDRESDAIKRSAPIAPATPKPSKLSSILRRVPYADLLKVFWENHDPTQVNRQGPDWGSQYRTAIFFHSPEQQVQAEKFKQELEKAHVYSKPIATQIVPAVHLLPGRRLPPAVSGKARPGQLPHQHLSCAVWPARGKRSKPRSGDRMQPTACPELVEGARAVGELNREGNKPRRGDRTAPLLTRIHALAGCRGRKKNNKINPPK